MVRLNYLGFFSLFAYLSLGDYGTPLPWYFLLQESYWLGGEGELFKFFLLRKKNKCLKLTPLALYWICVHCRGGSYMKCEIPD